MRKFVSGIGIVLILFGFTTSAYAQTTATRPGQIKREVVKERVETRKEIIADRKENITTKLDGLKIRIASKEASLKLRLNKFKDKTKALIVEKVSTVLNNINENRVTHSNRFLENASRILNKLQERVSNAASNGKDAASANAAISSARAKIASASAAVASQSAKEYTLSVSSESAAKAEIKATRDAFHGDWQSVRALLIDAKQAVANAIRVAATTLGGDNP
ncbi:hypothetical protein A3F00_01780 [Candidatus Daviesbacteria bacterium RIFCSPHIGHO2_12_FULL_37_11]|uniref:DUF5667 domain-containing protein n=1 Tax=Candidatus Daviesbacteria bacterium RIFCSPHIGHO2_12_FULL_37_11 TaxID=1797777 RepID=A0A1F5KDH4_9BACT|nr:MAG: hypothetical protein A3F00_01780 [Candidatus Daviesbacteria bacterium RIFCSPHIGHO2_12_FULL_37_11]OGE45562.1 MAG: hypothetical protein A3B39_05125 [Candidatus Daviesbacteria bacterium RIFCSPLOWO2_01_FULL_37_10]